MVTMESNSTNNQVDLTYQHAVNSVVMSFEDFLTVPILHLPSFHLTVTAGCKH